MIRRRTALRRSALSAAFAAHPPMRAAKIGVTNTSQHRSRRLATLQRHGWIPHTVFPFECAKAAIQLERDVLQRLRLEGAAPFLEPKDMPYGGWTETIDARLVPLTRLCDLVAESHDSLSTIGSGDREPYPGCGSGSATPGLGEPGRR